MSDKPNVWARRKARRALVQAVYQWQMSGTGYSAICQEFEASPALKKADVDHFRTVLREVLTGAGELDAHYSPHLDRSVQQLDVVERSVLRLATAEFEHHIEVPYRVVIDEYVELTKVFGAEESHKYVNGVLDKLAGTLRSLEVGARRG
ncbi:MAG: transcription antitermination factor NusB [Pseudomonadota bacterium]